MITRLFLVLALFPFGLVSSLSARYPPRNSESVKLSLRATEKQRQYQRRLKAPPEENPDKEDDDIEDTDVNEDNDVDTGIPTSFPTLVPTRLPTVSPSLSPTTAPTALPTTLPTQAPAVLPSTAVPSLEPKEKMTRAPVVLPSTDSSTESPTDIPTKAPSASTTTTAVTTRVPLQDFVIVVSYQTYVSVEALTQNLRTALKNHVQAIFSSLTTVNLYASEINRRLQDSQTASIEFTGDLVFFGTEQVTQDSIWALQTSFLQQFSPTTQGNNVELVSITNSENGDVFQSGDDTTSTSSATDGGNAADRNVGPTSQESSESFSAYGAVVGSLVAGIAIAAMAGVYYMRRPNPTGYQAHLDASLFELDKEEGSTAPILSNKTMIRVDTGEIEVEAESTTPTTQGSEPTDDLDTAVVAPKEEPGTTANVVPETTQEEQSICQTSLISGTLTSVAEEQSHEVIAEEEFVAEVGDENFDVSVLADADEEFAAKSSVEPQNQEIVVDPEMYSNWVTPLIHRIGSRTQDCCLKGARQNVMDTTLPHDLMMTDLELAEQTLPQTDLDPTFVAKFEGGDAVDAINTASPQDEPLASVEGTDQDKPVEDVEYGENIELSFEETDIKAGEEQNGGALRQYSSGKHYSMTSMFQRSSNVAAEEESSLNLSQQASFMTDDLDMGADLLDKALRDVTLFNPDEEPDSEFQVADYMHQIRAENKECEKTCNDEDTKEVTL